MKGSRLPEHIAIIMDGNGRWAKGRGKSRLTGHREGVKSVKAIVRACNDKGIKALTLFAFSTENWNRPKKEVTHLINLFILVMRREMNKLHKENVRIRFVGEVSAFDEKLQAEIDRSQGLTENNTGLTLVIAANYGGQWDICQAAKQLASEVAEKKLAVDDITQEKFQETLSLSDLPVPDLLIRTSGEYRISNFLLWQIAYAELYFTSVYWPDFRETELEKALEAFALRERRYGKTGDQLEEEPA